ncbi:MAG: 4-(cytidine 5'-diphospho)-2-C-methyl-D-erythritol kinase [Dehalococcoidaceae bacterium]|nr:4-(cytidine 5'-diphospho)-2-C-methyl-D-erythritol kinase [Dehalococcoidaceae bacterium]|tara:strand:+ start:82 stop:936 length:855 start_codon:yes stop_codon:yes gene_type:complete
MLTIKSPAKINFVLELLSKRDDNFHNISSIMAPISLYDEITIIKSKVNSINYFSDLNVHFDNAITQIHHICDLLAARSPKSFPVNININKVIPSPGGLGGVSSNLTNIIIALNDLWDIRLTQSDLKEIASQFGNDAIFFVDPHIAQISGKGEIITKLTSSFSANIVIIPMLNIKIPNNKTKSMYAKSLNQDMTMGEYTNNFINNLGGVISDDNQPYNAFERIIEREYPDQYFANQQIEQYIQKKVHLSGSGPTVYCLTDNKNDAEQIIDLLNQRDIQAFFAQII